MAALVCDLCGGKLIMGAGGIATCDSCGMEHSMERMREKVQEIKGTVQVEGSVAARQTGTSEDVAQWHSLLNKLIDAQDYNRAIEIVAKILEANPADEVANEIYNGLMTAKYIVVNDGVLEKYFGTATKVWIPSFAQIKVIGKNAFKENKSVKEIVLPDTVERFEECAFWGCSALQSINIPQGITLISDALFWGCSSLSTVSIPKGVTRIGKIAFQYCRSLASILLPEGVTRIDNLAFGNCSSLISISMPQSVISIGDMAFSFCGKLSSLIIPQNVTEIGDSAFFGCDSLANISVPVSVVHKWMAVNRCSHCGGAFKGLLSKVCRSCGRKKDY